MGKPSKDQIQEAISRIAIRSEENYLRAICESIVKYNYRARSDIFNILYEKFTSIEEETKNEEEQLLRRSLLAQMYVLMIQSAEDLALLLLMSLKSSPSESLRFYISNRNVDFKNFFADCIKGLSKSKILKIYHIQTAEKLLEKGFIKPEELNDFNSYIDTRIKGLKDYLKTIGKAYSTIKFDRAKKKMVPVTIGTVQVYYNLKHAYKVIIPTETGNKLFTFEPNHKSLDVIENMITLEEAFNRIGKNLPLGLKPYSNSQQIVTGGFKVTNSTAKIFVDRIKPFSDGIKYLAKIILQSLDNPEVQVQNFRFDINMNYKKIPEPKGYEPCPCGKLNPKTGLPMKYKKCHRKITLEE